MVWGLNSSRGKRFFSSQNRPDWLWVPPSLLFIGYQGSSLQQSYWGPVPVAAQGLRRRSVATHLLRSWVRIPPGAWMSVCCEWCVLSGRGLCDELITRPEESYRLWCVVCDLENTSLVNEQEGQGPLRGYCAKREKKKTLGDMILSTCLYVVLKVTNDESCTFIEISWNRSHCGMDNIMCCLECFASLSCCIFNCFIVLFASVLHLVHQTVFLTCFFSL